MVSCGNVESLLLLSFSHCHRPTHLLLSPIHLALNRLDTLPTWGLCSPEPCIEGCSWVEHCCGFVVVDLKELKSVLRPLCLKRGSHPLTLFHPTERRSKHAAYGYEKIRAQARRPQPRRQVVRVHILVLELWGFDGSGDDGCVVRLLFFKLFIFFIHSVF